MTDSNITKKQTKEQAYSPVNAPSIEEIGIPAKELIGICQKLRQLQDRGHDPVDVLQSIIDKGE